MYKWTIITIIVVLRELDEFINSYCPSSFLVFSYLSQVLPSIHIYIFLLVYYFMLNKWKPPLLIDSRGQSMEFGSITQFVKVLGFTLVFGWTSFLCT